MSALTVVKWIDESPKKSIADDICIFRNLDPFLRGMPLNQITRDEVEKIISGKSKNVSSGRVNRITALIRAVLGKAEREWGWIDKAPAIRRLKVDDKRIRWITKAEAERLYQESPPPPGSNGAAQLGDRHAGGKCDRLGMESNRYATESCLDSP